jgi:four helix bundle protein
MEDPRRLQVYTKSRELARAVFAATRTFPRYAWRAAAQLDEAADSIGANLAEGCGRRNSTHSNAELIKYCHYSAGELAEVRHRLETAVERGLLATDAYDNVAALAVEEQKMLTVFVRRLIDDDQGRARR